MYLCPSLVQSRSRVWRAHTTRCVLARGPNLVDVFGPVPYPIFQVHPFLPLGPPEALEAAPPDAEAAAHHEAGGRRRGRRTESVVRTVSTAGPLIEDVTEEVVEDQSEESTSSQDSASSQGDVRFEWHVLD